MKSLLEEWQLLILLLINAVVLHKPNRKGAVKGCSRENEAKRCFHLSMVCEEESVARAAKDQFKGTSSNTSFIVHISAN